MVVCYACKARELGYKDEVEMLTDLRLKKRKGLKELAQMFGVTQGAVSWKLRGMGMDDISQNLRKTGTGRREKI